MTSSTRFGVWSMLPCAEVIETLGRSGADFVGIDGQHGAHGFRDVVDAIRLLDVIGVERLVRVSELELELIPRFLDFGADGVIVAMVDDPDVARRAVALARYQPHGIRSYGGRRYGLSPEPDNLCDALPSVYAMIETVAALESIEEIVGVPGLSGVLVGPVDLALALGGDGPIVRRMSEAVAGVGEALPETETELAARWTDALAGVVDAAHRHGIEAGTFAIGAADALYWSSLGFDRVVVGSDIALLRSTLARELGTVRGSTPLAGQPGAGSQNDGGVTAASA